VTKHKADRHLDVLDYINDYAATHGYPPSVREIGRGVGVASTSTVHYYLARLRREGAIDMTPGRARGIRVGLPAMDARALDVATELVRAGKADFAPLPGQPLEGLCRRPGCRKPATVGIKDRWCSATCRTIGWWVKRWLRDADIEAGAIERTESVA
jgi:hypothetical protein